MCFKSSLLCAAAHARGVGTIGPVEYLVLRAKINNDADFVTKAQDLVQEQISHFGFAPPVVSEGTSTAAVGTINWAAIEAFLQFLIPLIQALFAK